MNWRKILLITADVALGTYLFFAVTAFNKPNGKSSLCHQLSINIADGKTEGFINAKDVRQRIDNSKIKIINQPLDNINCRQIEEMLLTTPFIKTAECYKTMDGTVTINVTQRMPVVRIMAASGDDYFIDDKDCIMPRTHYTSDLMVVTGNVSRRFAKESISPMARTIMANELWRNMFEQINVRQDRSIEMVPRVGDHTIYLGQLPTNKNTEVQKELIDKYIKEKLTLLEDFYRYGLVQVGWNKYSLINLEFSNQIICKKNPNKPAAPAAETEPAANTAEQAPATAAEG